MKNIISLDNTNLARIFQIIKDSNDNYLFNLNDTITIDKIDISENYYILHKVQHKESYQSISYHYYGTTRLWWLITKFNKIENVINLPKPGTVLQILNNDIVQSILKELKNS